ncbi:MAG: hypothetical protein DMD53_10915 [Gemmatimonadetes bacterium]|nr:MAG: hypothetical protein DMD53_10915 [Gemmatimonadota bacterium]
MGGLGRDRRGQRGDRTPTPRPRHPPGRFARRPERPACAVGIFQAPLTMRTPPPLALVLLALACVSEHGPLTNRMSQSTTSYLTRAARQPVSWQPWGREAFALAARLDRPVLLYVGADDCRWCVVMDREVYGDPTIGAVIDSLFVPVRVDRDERPDVAQRYEAAVQWLAGLRGYPLTLFLTPDGSAFLGGTYFPADDPVTGRGMKQMLPEVARSYREQRRAIDQHAALARQLAASRGAAARGALRPGVIAAAIDTVRDALAAAARAAGGLGSFVHTQAAALLLAAYARTDDTSYLAVARRALDLLVDSAAGASSPAAGVRDDPPSLVRAGLLRAVAQAWALTAEARYRVVSGALLRFLTRDLGEADRPVFADRDAYVIGSVLDGATAVDDSGATARGLAALDRLLRRTYVAGRGVRHALRGDAGRSWLRDQVQVAGACLAAYNATGRRRYLAVAEDLAAVLERDYADPQGGYRDVAAGDPAVSSLADRTSSVLDDLLPGGNAWAARVLLQLAEATGDAQYRRRAAAALGAFAAVAPAQNVRAATYLGAAQQLLAAR